jgi:nucleotide-binding universal stress UspA family protein
MYQRILVPVDGSPTSNAGLAEAIRLAKLTGARMRVLHVVDEMPYLMRADGYAAMSGGVDALMARAAQAILEQARAQIEAAGIPGDAASFDGLNGRLRECVAEQAQEWHADLIVLGTRGRRGVGRMLLGSDAEQIMRTATVRVLLVRGTFSSGVDHTASAGSAPARLEPA